MPRLQPRNSSSGLVLGNQLKIKPNHIIPSVSTQRQKVAQFQKLQMAPQQRKTSKFLNQQPIARSILNSTNISPNKRPRPSNYHQQQGSFNSSQPNNSSSARTNGLSSVQSQSSIFNGGSNTPRLSIASIQQQQKNAFQLTQSKPQKNVPRCSVCNRTFATNQVLQRHMVCKNVLPKIFCHGQIVFIN